MKCLSEHLYGLSQAYTPTTSNRIKVTDTAARIISVDAYGFYTIVRGKPRPFQRLQRFVTAESGLAYVITVLCILA